MSSTSKAGYSNHIIDEFTFELVNDTTVNVRGPKDIRDKSLSFVKENGNYFFDSIGDVLKKGQSTYTLPNGTNYVGEFKDGKKNGQGTFTWPNGTVKSGIWIEGKYSG